MTGRSDNSVVVIDPDDRRSCLALLLAAEADTWGRVVNKVTGEVGWAIPSQRWVGVYHLATTDRCTCVDSKRGGLGHLCKHSRAVRVHDVLQIATASAPRRRRHIAKGDDQRQ